jgi:CRISPR-associated endonuclease/helicase Cas3
MERAGNKASRLLQIEALLVGHPEGLTPAEIARRLDVHRSTIGRYLPDLPKHIYVDDMDGDRWKIDRDADLVNVRFTLHEAMAVHLAGRLLADWSNRRNPHASAALRKLGIALERLAPLISNHLLASAEVMDDEAQRHDPVYREVLETLTRAWSERRKVRVWHQNEKTQQIHEYIFAPYFIEPYAIGQTTHVIGWRQPPGALRTFKLERIRHIERLIEPYQIAPGFDPRRLLADAWGIWYTEDKPQEVVLMFHPRVARRVQETRWHRSEKVEEQPDGYLIWRAQVAEPREMLPWVRGWGGDCEVLEPKELRESVRIEAGRLARLYGIAPTEENPSMNRLLRCWGKTNESSKEFHPAVFHMLDVGHVARELLSERASPRWRRVLAEALGTEAETLVGWLPFIVALHDVGKISATFQGLRDEQKARLTAEGLSFGQWRPSLDLHHSVVGQVFVTDELATTNALLMPPSMQQAWGEMVGGHHGEFIARDSLKQARNILKVYEPPEWANLRVAAADILKDHLLKQVPDNRPKPANISAAVMALTGFTILCDWLGSDSLHFPPQPEADLCEYVEKSARQAQHIVEATGFLHASKSAAPVGFSLLFPDKKPPRPVQKAIDAIPDKLLAKPCLVVIEAPTGEGKTEAALALAHRLAQASGTDELYYALPTTATSNQMFGRLQIHLRDGLALKTLAKLVHGQAFLVEDDLRIELLGNGNESGNEKDRQAALEWFGPKKRALLAPFGVGTIDQAELAALNVRHTALRLMGLAGKALVFDEVHAYDTYMTTIVEGLLKWLAALGTSVIVLSATLPKARRAALARAYGVNVDLKPEEREAYPSLWVVSQGGSYHTSPPAQQNDRQLQLSTLHLSDDDPEAKARWLLDAVANGGCVCWMTNTVERAQKMFGIVDKQAPPDVDRLLLHARFPLEDRQAREETLIEKYGPKGEMRPKRGIVIGTQVLEQSLDLDFDVMASDLAPVDLLLQRAGRLHRHPRQRPTAYSVPRLWINAELETDGGLKLGVDKGIYAEFFLRQTWLTLANRFEISLPADYRPLIEAVYGATKPASDSLLAHAWEQLEKQKYNAVGEARLRLLPDPDPKESFCASAAKLQFEEDENSAAWIVAQTRLGEESVAVIPLEKKGNQASFSPTGEQVNLDAAAPREIQLRLLRRSLRISHREVVQAIKASRGAMPRLFTHSALLKGYAPLWLSDGQTRWPRTKGMLVLTLDPQLGLVITKEGG